MTDYILLSHECQGKPRTRGGNLLKRIEYHRYGGPEELQLAETPIPEPGRCEVRVRIRAASANPADWKVRTGNLRLISGSRFPRGYGHDFAGVVDAVGLGVTRCKKGDEVYGISSIRNAGAFADYLKIVERDVYPKPAHVSFEAAAALPMASVTALSAVVDLAGVRPGQSVFVAGCLGNLGRAAVQLALMRGADVAGNCSAARREEALTLGVIEVSDYRDFDAGVYRGRFDLVFDTAGGLTLKESMSMLTRGGIAVHAAPRARQLPLLLLSRRHAVASGRALKSRMLGVTDAAKRGALVPNIVRTVSLADAIPALVELETAGTIKGKLVIVPG